jgi:MerR family transcriptional regulator, light-induced transcriptional regulator
MRSAKAWFARQIVRLQQVLQAEQLTEETAMQSDASGGNSASGRRPSSTEWANDERDASWTDADGGANAAKLRLAKLARTIETDVIPRLVQAHRPAAANAATRANAGMASNETRPQAAELEQFVAQIIHDGEAKIAATLQSLRTRGVSVESIYLHWFGPTARRLGEMWEEDECDFSTVTVALGRLQRLLRELSPAFGSEVEHPANGRRALFVQPRDEQHSFGLSMVAEFFRRDGWDVIGGVGGAVTDPAALVRAEWVDVVGFSVGTDVRLPWLRDTIAGVRAASRNPGLHVLVGGPPFAADVDLAAACGADGTARDGKDAPKVAETLLARGAQGALRK